MDFVAPIQAIEKLAGPLRPEQVLQLEAYGDAIVKASGRLSLVSRRELSNLGVHFTDSAGLLRFRDVRTGAMADLGSGAGLPGIVVAIMRPEVAVTLVESQRRKVVFLKKVVRELKLGNLEVHHGRLEELPEGRRFDTAAVRALEDPLRMLPHCLEFVAPSGALVLFKGPRWEQESCEVAGIAARYGFAITRTETIALPGTQRSTVFVELSRR